MNLIYAASETLKKMDPENWHYEHVSPHSLNKPIGADKRMPDVSHEPDSFEHVQWMLNGIVEGYIKGEKGHRWIGWAQAVIHIHQEDMPLDTFKEING